VTGKKKAGSIHFRTAQQFSNPPVPKVVLRDRLGEEGVMSEHGRTCYPE
jgi:hypothetical protein